MSVSTLTMNPLILLALVIRDLLPHPEELIRFGRLNEEREWFSDDYIVVDRLAPATRFALLIQSQASRDLQEALGLGVYQASGLTDVKMLTSQQYGERQELTLNVRYATAADIDTLRIDTAQIELRTEIGLELEP